jgi:hypothetical protein
MRRPACASVCHVYLAAIPLPLFSICNRPGCRFKRRPAPNNSLSLSTTLSYLSSRPERSGGEGSAVRHSDAPPFPFYNPRNHHPRTPNRNSTPASAPPISAKSRLSIQNSSRAQQQPSPFQQPSPMLSSRPERSGGEGSAVRHSDAPPFPFYNPRNHQPRTPTALPLPLQHLP